MTGWNGPPTGGPVQGTAPSPVTYWNGHPSGSLRLSVRGVGEGWSSYSQAPVATADDEAWPVTAASSTCS